MDPKNTDHAQAASLGLDDDTIDAVDDAGLDWQRIFEVIRSYGPVVVDVIKRLLHRGTP